MDRIIPFLLQARSAIKDNLIYKPETSRFHPNSWSGPTSLPAVCQQPSLKSA